MEIMEHESNTYWKNTDNIIGGERKAKTQKTTILWEGNYKQNMHEQQPQHIHKARS